MPTSECRYPSSSDLTIMTLLALASEAAGEVGGEDVTSVVVVEEWWEELRLEADTTPSTICWNSTIWDSVEITPGRPGRNSRPTLLSSLGSLEVI
jgi:hypothetical protein